MLTLPASNEALSSNGSFAAVNGSNGLYGTRFISTPVTTLRAFKLVLLDYSYDYNGEDDNNWANNKYARHHPPYIIISLIGLVDCLINCRVHRLYTPSCSQLIFGGN
ncbi:MAG TPA: hypothetical protein VLH86_03285 [Patescibacteria group bacterium]|nr:hypothetical protein [Patescibacteria group bacterium]